jgi:small-conductance mechanosensitive channel
VVPQARDAEIAERLQRILRSTGWFESPRVSVSDGVVFLDGRTSTQEHKSWATALAESTQGSVAVVNRLEVEADVESTLERAGDELTGLYRQAVQGWPLLVVVIVILAVTWLVARILGALSRRFFARRIASPLLLNLAVRAVTIPVFILGVYLTLQVSGLTRLALTVLGGTGLAGIIVGFAFRDIAENFLASLLLSIRNPFRQGDLIEVAGHTGVVKNLNVRTTVLLSLDGNQVQIPNAAVFKSTITNYSSIPSRRADFVVGISYDSSTAKAQSLIDDILRRHPAVLDTPEPVVLVEELGAATVNLRAYYWFDSATYSPAKINSALLRLTMNALLKNGIELPDSAREVIFPKGVPVSDLRTAKKTKAADEAGAVAEHARRTPSDSETKAITAAEGNLSNESADIDRRAVGNLPEAEENLLSESKLPADGELRQ